MVPQILVRIPISHYHARFLCSYAWIEGPCPGYPFSCLGYGLSLSVVFTKLTRPNIYAGHIRPMCNLASRIVKAHHVHLTLLAADVLFERTEAEVTRNFEEGEEHLCDLIR